MPAHCSPSRLGPHVPQACHSLRLSPLFLLLASILMPACSEPIIGFKGIPSGDVGTNAASKRGSSGSLLQAPSVLVDATAGGSGGPLVDSSGPLVETAAISSGM